MDRIDRLEKRTITFLEKTKKDMFKYSEQRKKADKYLIERKNLDEWEQYLSEIEKLL